MTDDDLDYLAEQIRRVLFTGAQTFALKIETRDDDAHYRAETKHLSLSSGQVRAVLAALTEYPDALTADVVLNIGQPRHLSMRDVANDASVWRTRGTVIGDACAATIASWYQGPVRGNGLAFAELASSGRARVGDLHADIERSATRDAQNDDDRRDLAALAAWVDDKAAKS